jgi:hypothetical protein
VSLNFICFRRFLPLFLICCATSMSVLGQQAPPSAELPWEPKHIMFESGSERLYRHEAVLQGDTVYTLG